MSEEVEEKQESKAHINLRDYQKEAINFIIDSLNNGKNPIVEMPTGSGKTLVGLISTLKYAKSNGKKVLYLSRTNSQQEHILREIRLIRKEIEFKALAMQGRINMCPLYMEIEKDEEFSAESLSKMCSSRKKKTLERKEGGCKYYNDEIKSDETKNTILSSSFSPQEIFFRLKSRTICPYESIKFAMRDADLVVMPYPYFVNSILALSTIYNWRTSRENIIVLVDEAHNLPEIAREENSLKITSHMIDLAEREVIDQGDPQLLPGIHASDFADAIREALIEIGRDLNENRNEKRIMFREIFDTMAIYLKKNPEDVDYLVESLLSLGDQVEERLEKAGRVPMSRAKSLSEKLKFMMHGEENNYICTISRDGNMSLEAYCLDPSIMLEPMFKSQSVHLSATLAPVEMYIDITGVTNETVKIFKDIFPKENLRVLYSKELTTKYSELNYEMATRYAKEILDLIAMNQKKTIVFFPSFNTMHFIESKMPSLDHLSEHRGMNQIEFNILMNEFKNKQKPIFGVMGGRLSEGINLPGNQLELVVICGIPFPKPTIKQRALAAYYDMKFRAGWEHAFLAPAITKVRQAIGRVIRSKDDIGVVVILDSRAEMLFPYISPTLTKDPAPDVNIFFREKGI